MTQIYLHPSIADHFVEYDFSSISRSPTDGSASDLRRAVIKDYIDEKVILLRNVRIDADYGLCDPPLFRSNGTTRSSPLCRSRQTSGRDESEDPHRR